LAAKRWTSGQRERLGALLTERREELDPRYYVREVFAAEREINLRMAADLEKGRPRNFTPLTLRDVVAPAYGVTYESVLAAADGGDLEAAPGSPHKQRGPRLVPAAEHASGAPEVPVGFISPEMEAAARPGAEAIWRKLLDLAREGIASPSGAQLFADPLAAAVWDRAVSKGRTERERVWLLAAFQADAPAASGRESGTGLAG
jgi:hypothetical protein